jgi:hypothetical protein
MIGLLANWRILAALGAVAALVGAYLWIDHRAYARGVAATERTWLDREATELQEANAEILRLTAEVANRERTAAAAIAAADNRYQQELARVQADRKRFMSDVTSGRVRYYVPTASQSADRGPGPAPAATAGSGDDRAQSELPQPVQRALAGAGDLLADADEVVVQLGLAQATIRAYVQECGSSHE